MFSRYSTSTNYSSLGNSNRGTLEPIITISNGNGRRAFRDVTNAKGNQNGNTGKFRSTVHTRNDKKVKYQAAKFQITVAPSSQPNSCIPKTATGQQLQSRQQKNPLLPAVINHQANAVTHHASISKAHVAAFSYQFTGKVDNIDERCVDDPVCATDYVEDMYALFRKKEGLTAVLPVYMESTQGHINEKMRAILIDWLVEVHMKFKLVPETLFLTVSLIDRYLERREISRSNLQLLGVSCLMIAAKYEEIWPPGIGELVYICDNAYTKTTIIKMETQILKTLEYQITQPSAHTFLVRYLKAGHADKEMSQLACYLLDGTLMSYSMLNYLPSQLAAASVFLARHACGRHPWSPTLLKYSEYLEEDIAPVARALLEEKSAVSPDLQSLGKKYSSSRYGNVTSIPLSFDF